MGWCLSRQVVTFKYQKLCWDFVLLCFWVTNRERMDCISLTIFSFTSYQQILHIMMTILSC